LAEAVPSSVDLLVIGEIGKNYSGAGIDPNEARARGVDEVIAKPYRIAELRQIADRVAGPDEPVQ